MLSGSRLGQESREPMTVDGHRLKWLLATYGTILIDTGFEAKSQGPFNAYAKCIL